MYLFCFGKRVQTRRNQVSEPNWKEKDPLFVEEVFEAVPARVCKLWLPQVESHGADRGEGCSSRAGGGGGGG